MTIPDAACGKLTRLVHFQEDMHLQHVAYSISTSLWPDSWSVSQNHPWSVYKLKVEGASKGEKCQDVACEITSKQRLGWIVKVRTSWWIYQCGQSFLCGAGGKAKNSSFAVSPKGVILQLSWGGTAYSGVTKNHELFARNKLESRKCLNTVHQNIKL